MNIKQLQTMAGFSSRLSEKFFENFQIKFENILVLKLEELKTQYAELINGKNEEIRKLKDKVDYLEEKCDEAEAYSRRDCIIVSGDDIPTETASENTTSVVQQLFRGKLGLEFADKEINVSHRIGKRLGPTASKRKIIVKLCRRSVNN